METITEEKTFMQKHGAKIKVAGAFVLGCVATYAVTSNSDQIVRAIQVNLGYKNENTIITIINGRGHPGFVVKDPKTGEIFASKNMAAQALDVPRQSIDNLVATGALEILGLAGPPAE